MMAMRWGDGGDNRKVGMLTERLQFVGLKFQLNELVDFSCNKTFLSRDFCELPQPSTHAIISRFFFDVPRLHTVNFKVS